MTALRSASTKPALWLAVVAGLLAFCVQSGELGSADTTHRLQTAHSFWTSEPAVFPNEYPEFGVHGRGGKLYDWYGVGQSLLLLPADIIGTGIAKLPVFADYGDADPTVRSIFVTCATSIFINVLTALVCYQFLLLLGFDMAQSVAGVLALFFCTTHLHYTQNMMENNYILLLTFAGFRYQYEWLLTGKRRPLLIGSAAFGLNLLTRLTTGIDLIMGGIFLLLVLWFERASNSCVGTGVHGEPALSDRLKEGSRTGPVDHSSTFRFWPHLRKRLIPYLKIALPIYTLFLFFDRLYQFHRFGNWTTTYVHYFTIERRLQDPSLPANYPWTTPFLKGFLGALISPEKAIFLFDPLIVLTLVLAFAGWKRFSSSVKAYLLATLFLILTYICFYARYYEWSGNFAWGDRYVSSVIEMAAFISVPLLLKFRAQFSRPIWTIGIFLIVVSLLVQLASLAFWLPLEIYQADDFGHPQWVIWLRFKNIVAFALGKMDGWGLNTDSMKYDQWDYQHISCWNFLPFVLRRIGEAPAWVVDVAFGIWLAGIGALTATLGTLGRMVEIYGRMLP